LIPMVAGLVLIAAIVALAVVGLRQAAADGQPSFLFPWQDGVTWYTGEAGFHSTNDAIDFFPPDTGFSETVRCVGDPDWVFEESAYWVLASAPGTVSDTGEAYVTLDHGGGWYSRYYHLSDHQVALGDVVQTGQRLGHPSTLGDCSSGPHVHFWVQGPDGQTTRNVALSGVPTTGLGINEPRSATGNYDIGVEPTPTPTAAPTDTPTPTSAPTDTPTPTPSPTPQVFAAGDANCDGLVTPADALIILQVSAGIDPSACAASHSETNCDGAVTPADAIAVLEMTLGDRAQPAKAACESPSPTVEPSPTPTPEQTAEPSDTSTVALAARSTTAPTR
jgi:murein DD-endopeptidase MepM/ murein hydrolase activator NlpD